jgi:hypothetical protein
MRMGRMGKRGRGGGSVNFLTWVVKWVSATFVSVMVRSEEEGKGAGWCETREYRFTGKSMGELCLICRVSSRKIIQYVATYNKRNKDKPALVGAALLEVLLQVYTDKTLLLLSAAAITDKEQELLIKRHPSAPQTKHSRAKSR